jgi:TRAP-type mannitol/chloroaromatic compound transport system permease small subunit
VSWNSPARIQIYFFKTLIPVAGALMFLQGVAELLRCWKAMKEGVWLERTDDIHETEETLMAQVHLPETLAPTQTPAPGPEQKP